MSYEQQNRQALINYFRKGAKGSNALGALGVEVEHFVVHNTTLEPVPYAASEGNLGVRDILVHLAQYYPEETRGLKGELLGLANPDGSITLEPAAQLEISIAPFPDVASVVRVYNEFRSYVDPFLATYNCTLMACGYHPSAKAHDLQLIPKQRYRFMDSYFTEIGTHGERMMRASASTQVSVDYANEADAVRKMRVAQALAVVLASITSNTAVFEGAPVTEPLPRFALWRDVDNRRCGSVPGLFDEGFGFEAYANWISTTCPIFVTRPAANDPDGLRLRSVVGHTTEEAYSDAPMSTADVEHALSMFWPDVRLKTFVEIRPADSLPVELIAGYTAFIKGLFYSEQSLQAIEEAIGVVNGVWPLTDTSTDEFLARVQAQGYEAEFCGKTLAQWEQFLLNLAAAALNESENAYLEALARKVSARQQA